MKSRTFITAFLLLLSVTITAQVPQGFNYQAIARDAGGAIIANGNMTLQITLQSTSIGGTIIWQENHSLTSNQFGLIGCVVGKGTRVAGNVATFDLIDWNAQTVYIKTGIKYPTSAPTFVDMGTTQVFAVPYALLANKATSLVPGAKLSVTSSNDTDPSALFEVKRKDGQTVFAVYPDAVNVYVPTGAKGTKGGFTVGGFDGANKTDPYELFRVTPDSVRIYIDPTPSLTKGSKGGFAVGGYGAAKGGINSMYFNLSAATVANTVASSQQVLWYPVKKAFIAGNVRIAHVDSVGDYSTSLGYQSQASGDYSQAFGYKAKAMGDYSTSIGKKSVAGVFNSKHNAFALGNAAQATGEDSYALGSGALASGLRSFAFGSVGLDEGTGLPTSTPTSATANYTVAIGMGATASGVGSMALGIVSNSAGPYSTSLGYYSSTAAGANYSIALGYRATANGFYSSALGARSISAGSYSTAVGYYAEATASNSGALGYYSQADGAQSTALGYRAWALGQNSIAVGDSSKTQGTSSGAFGGYAKAKGNNSVAVGYNAKTTVIATGAASFGQNAAAKSANSVAIGYGAQTIGADASAFGKNAIANGTNSVAIGYGSSTGASATSANAFGTTAVANGQYSLALGTTTTAGGNYSTAVGYNASAAGANAISFGISTVASATNSAAFGTSAQATASNALAMGTSTIASGTNSTAIGYQSQAQSDKSIAIGSYYSLSYSLPKLTLGKGEEDDGEKGLEDLLPIRPIIPITILPLTFNRANIANGQYSVAIGNGNLAQAGGFVFGSNSDALQFGAVALGTSAKANNTNSIAAGYNSTAAGVYSVAIGNNVAANSYGEIALGQFSESIVGSAIEWREGDLLMSVGNGIEDANRSNALTIYKDGKTIIRGRYAVSTLNYKVRRRMPFPLFPITYKDYVYGMYTNLSRDDAAIEYYYSGYFAATGTAGTYRGLYADLFTTPEASITTLISSGAYSTVIGSTYRDVYVDNTGLIGNLVSSARYKEDIENLNDVNWIYNLRPVEYKYKTSTSDNREMGLIAEEVVDVKPDLVSFNESGDPETVVYSKLVTPLLKAIQDQKSTIEELKSENEMLLERLEKLEASVSKISKKQRK